MKIKNKDRMKIGADLLAALMSNPGWTGTDEERAAHAWALAGMYCDVVETACKASKDPTPA